MNNHAAGHHRRKGRRHTELYRKKPREAMLPLTPDRQQASIPRETAGRSRCAATPHRPGSVPRFEKTSRFDHRTAPCRLAPRRGPAPVSRIAGQKRRLDTENAPQHAPIEAGPDLKTGSASQPREQRGRHKPYAAIPNMGRERSASPAEFERSRTPQDTRFPQLPPRLPGTAVQPAPLK